MTTSKLLYKFLRNRWERTVAVAALIVGAISLLAGWLGISRATLTTEQLPYLASGGLIGLFALGIAATCWLSADMRDEFHTLLQIKRLLAESADADQKVPGATGEISLDPGGEQTSAAPYLTAGLASER